MRHMKQRQIRGLRVTVVAPSQKKAEQALDAFERGDTIRVSDVAVVAGRIRAGAFDLRIKDDR